MNEDPEAFRVFNEWLYSGAVTYEQYATHHGNRWSALFNLYIFAEKRIIPKFQNAVIDAMIRFAEESETHSEKGINLVWMKTPTSSPLRTFLVDVYARSVPIAECFRQTTERRKRFDVDFVKRVAIALYEMVEDPRGHRNGLTGLWKDRCLWHVHGPEDPPCRDDISLTGSK